MEWAVDGVHRVPQVGPSVQWSRRVAVRGSSGVSAPLFRQRCPTPSGTGLVKGTRPSRIRPRYAPDCQGTGKVCSGTAIHCVTTGTRRGPGRLRAPRISATRPICPDPTIQAKPIKDSGGAWTRAHGPRILHIPKPPATMSSVPRAPR